MNRELTLEVLSEAYLLLANRLYQATGHSAADSAVIGLILALRKRRGDDEALELVQEAFQIAAKRVDEGDRQ